MTKIIQPEATVNKIVQGTTIKGEIIANGDFRIDGSLVGKIQSKGRIVVGNSGSIEGEINCQNADISGIVNASVVVAELLSLKATASIRGDVKTNKLAIEPGAKFSGTCTMDEESPKIHIPLTRNEKLQAEEKIHT